MDKITKRSENFSQWYIDVIREAKLADYSAVKGCMVIRPNGMDIWERIREYLDIKFKETGHRNAYFPLFIPKSFLSKEAEHVKGFAKECAVVTHYRLKSSSDSNVLTVDPDAKLEEELIVRPTSETIIWNSYKNWIQSYRDLPILINQWANIVRWEMRTRLFLRTTEFLWQEGHTAHENFEDAEKETLQMLEIYRDFVENTLAIPVLVGKKTENEKFAGALKTYTIEGMMQDKKALQMGTSHNLGQNFAKAFDVKFLDRNKKLQYVWATSWGVSTRLIGALIMAHSDDHGLVLPPKIATIKIVIVPIYKSTNIPEINNYVNNIKSILIEHGFTTIFDDRENINAGYKFHEWEAQGIPIRLEIGEKELSNNSVVAVRRDTLTKQSIFVDNLINSISEILSKIQYNLFNKAKEYQFNNISEADSIEKVQEIIALGGFAKVFWDGSKEDEQKLSNFQSSIRCILLNNNVMGKCILTGKSTDQIVIIAKSY